MTNAEELRRAIEDAAKALKETYNYDDATLETLFNDERKRKARLKMLEEAEQRERKANDDNQ